MTEATTGSDMGIGVAMLFGLLGIGGAVVMYAAAVGHNQVLSAWGFAGAMTAAAILIAAIHLYE